MILQRLSILNYKNIAEATLELSPKLNCFIGSNGAGKTNVLDAVYFLSFCRSMHTSVDSLVMRHDADFFVLEGSYEVEPEGVGSASTLNIYAGMKRGTKKHFKRDKK